MAKAKIGIIIAIAIVIGIIAATSSTFLSPSEVAEDTEISEPQSTETETEPAAQGRNIVVELEESMGITQGP